MIVQCSQCQAKYRIADEKVRGAGVKVRCAKCKNVFTVKPPGKSAPSTPPPAKEPPLPPQQEETTDSAPPESPEPPGEAPLPPLGGDLPPPSGREEDPAAGEKSPVGEDLSTTGLGEDLSTTGLGEDLPTTGQSEDLSTTGQPEAPQLDNGSSGEGETETDWGNIALGETSQEAPEEDMGLTAASPPVQPPTGFPSPPPEPEGGISTFAGAPSPTDRATTTSVQTSPPREKSGKGLLLVLLLVVLGAGTYFVYPKVRDTVRSRTTAEEGSLVVEDVTVGTVKRPDGVILAVVRGVIRNDTGKSRGMIRVKGMFKGDGKTLAEASSYCGNTLTDNELSAAGLESIRSSMENELGKNLSNSSLEHGGSIPFLIILENPPLRITEVTVTVESWQNTT